MLRLFISAIVGYCLLINIACLGQVIQPSSHAREYYDLLSLYNPEMPKPISIYPSIISQYKLDTTLQWNLWGEYFDLPEKSNQKVEFDWVDPFLNYSANTLTPRGYNDGAIWAGKGSNVAVSTGFIGKIGILNFAFVPIATWSENKPIQIPQNVTGDVISPYAYPFSNRLDYVQQFGDGGYSQFSLGQSEVRLVYKKMTLGVSTENFQLGPSIWNPILFSMNAAGIPHMDFGTAAPVQTKIGNFEAKWFWGKTQESDYFDQVDENDRKYVTGISMGYEPSFIRGLSLGLNRIMYTRWADGDLGTKDFFSAFVRNKDNDGKKNDEYDQMFSFMLRYRFPSVGFEFYTEYAKNDFPGNFNDWFEQPDRTRAIILGVVKAFEFENKNVLKFSYEYTSLSKNQLQLLPQNGVPPYYIHSEVENGFTHQGQILGAGIGPGSNSDLMKVDLFTPNGKYGFIFSRIRFNDDYFLNAYSNSPEPYPMDYEATVALEYIRYFSRFYLKPQIMWNYRKNWFYQDEVEVHNFHFELQASYRLNKRK